MKLDLKFNFAALPGLAKKYIQFVLWAFLIIVLAMEFFVIKNSVDLALLARTTAPGAQAQIVRVNFEQYKAIEKRLQDNTGFQPQPVKYTNPFGLAPAK